MGIMWDTVWPELSSGATYLLYIAFMWVAMAHIILATIFFDFFFFFFYASYIISNLLITVQIIREN